MKIIKRIALVIVTILMALGYRIDGQPLPETAEYLAGDHYRVALFRSHKSVKPNDVGKNVDAAFPGDT